MPHIVSEGFRPQDSTGDFVSVQKTWLRPIASGKAIDRGWKEAILQPDK
jgi:hypothetical protein